MASVPSKRVTARLPATGSIRARTGSERGQVLPLVALALVPILAMAAMTIDVGIWRYQQQLAQNAADSGALAALVALANSKPLDQIYTAANVDTTANGFAGSSTNNALNTTSNVTVTVNNPPASGPSSTDSSAVEVIVKKALPTYVGSATVTISARAVATNAISGNCITALDTASSKAFNDSGGDTINMPKCSIQSNTGLDLNGGTINASSIGYNASSQVGIAGTTVFTGATPAPTAQVVDPCPTIAGCAYLTANTPTGTVFPTSTFTGSTTLQPGTYNSTNLVFNGSGTITFAAGVYYFPNGFKVQGTINLDASAGVTFYNGGTISTNNYGFNIVAPTTGPTAGVAIFQPASDTAALTFNGNGQRVLNGLVYTPSAYLNLNSSSSTTYITNLVAKDIALNGGGTISSITSASSSSSSGASGLSE